MEKTVSPIRREYIRKGRGKIMLVLSLALLSLVLMAIGICVGSSKMSFVDSLDAFFGKGTNSAIRIVWNIRLPRVLSAFIAGMGLSLSGLIMQTVLGNQMASPSTLGVSNAAVFGANLSIIAFSGGFIAGGNINSVFDAGVNPYVVSLFAFAFAILSVLLILGLCSIRSFSPGAVVLAGIAIGSIWSAGTTILQYYSTDVGIAAAVVWSFGDLGRATYQSDLIMLITVLVGIVYFAISSWKYNSMLGGENMAKSLGVNVKLLRFLSLLIASMITAVCVSFLGIIGFVGIICPHIMKRILGSDHRYLIPASLFSGSVLLLFADILTRTLGNGAAIPIGAITSLIGAPFFLFVIFTGRRKTK